MSGSIRPLAEIRPSSKTYTATAIMALAEAGEVGLDDTVRAYVPELRLKDEAAAALSHRLTAARPARAPAWRW
jgi:CubicO group peptidase (beta-lactamase class C family)